MRSSLARKGTTPSVYTLWNLNAGHMGWTFEALVELFILGWDAVTASSLITKKAHRNQAEGLQLAIAQVNFKGTKGSRVASHAGSPMSYVL